MAHSVRRKQGRKQAGTRDGCYSAGFDTGKGFQTLITCCLAMDQMLNTAGNGPTRPGTTVLILNRTVPNTAKVFRTRSLPPKEWVPPRKGAPALRVRQRRMPSSGTCSRERHELAHSGAQTACRSYPRSCARLGCAPMGWKVKTYIYL